MYVDWLRDVPGTIRWDSFGNDADLPVRIDLYQDGPNGPEPFLNITPITDDDGLFDWTPANDLVDYGTYGLRIQVTLVDPALNHSMALDRSSETFTVPENTQFYYVNDDSLDGDQHTTAAGDNRNTGKLSDRPKPYPNNVLRIYTVGAGQTMVTDAGSYALFDPTVVSNVQGIGDDEGFIWQGPTTPGQTAELWHAHPATEAALVELNDADLVTIRHLVLDDAQRGVWLHNGSTRFTGEHLHVSGHTLDGIRIADESEFTQLNNITATNNGQYGIWVTSAIDQITDSQISNNAQRGIYVTNQEGILIDGNTVEANGKYGIYFQAIAGDDSTLTDNTVSGGERGVFVDATTGGNVTVSSGAVFDTTITGIEAKGSVLVERNAVHDNANLGIMVYWGAEAVENVVFNSAVGIEVGKTHSSATARRNRVYNQTVQGMMAYRNSQVLENVVYTNPIGIGGTLFWRSFHRHDCQQPGVRPFRAGHPCEQRQRVRCSRQYGLPGNWRRHSGAGQFHECGPAEQHCLDDRRLRRVGCQR